MSGEGSVFPTKVPTPDGRTRTVWVAQLSSGPREHRSYQRRKRPTKALANAALAQLKADRDAGRDVTKLSLGSYLHRWLAETVTTVRPNTRRGYEDALEHWTPIASIGLADLRAEDIEWCSNRMTTRRHNAHSQRPASDKTVRNAQVMLRSALSDAYDRGHIRRNEAALVKLRRVGRIHKPALTPERAVAVLQAVQGDRYEAAFWLALVGLRASEILGLSWADIDLAARTARLWQQTSGSGRRARLAPLKTDASADVVGLPAPVVDVLREHRARQLVERAAAGRPTVEGLVFVTAKTARRPGGLAVNGSWLTKHFQARLERAGLPRMTIHELRHGYATLLAGLNVHPAIAQRLMRHAKATTTLDLYTRVTADQERIAVDQLGVVLGESRRESRAAGAES